jgi:hypothetical protein
VVSVNEEQENNFKGDISPSRFTKRPCPFDVLMNDCLSSVKVNLLSQTFKNLFFHKIFLHQISVSLNYFQGQYINPVGSFIPLKIRVTSKVLGLGVACVSFEMVQS